MGGYEGGLPEMQGIAVKATRILQRLVRSSEGCRELLAHPVCSSTFPSAHFTRPPLGATCCLRRLLPPASFTQVPALCTLHARTHAATSLFHVAVLTVEAAGQAWCCRRW
jgi:hypothetical protein